MRNTRWLRYGLASLIVAGTGLSATLVACGDDENNGTSGTVPTEASTTDQVAPPGDGGPDADAAVKPPGAKLTLVNATTDLGPNAVLNARGDAAIRVCFRAGTTQETLIGSPFPALPNKPSASAPAGTPPGIFYGTGGTFPTFGTLDLETLIIVPMVMNAKSLALKGEVNPANQQPYACDELIGATAPDASAGGLIPNVDYWELPPIPAGTFVKDKAFVLVLTGCAGDATIANKNKCGANPPAGTEPGVGNLAVKIFETARAPVSPTQLGVQFLHGSTQANALLTPSAFPVEPGIMSNPADASTFKPVTAGPAAVLTLSPVLGVTGVQPTDFFVTSRNEFNGGAQGVATAPFPLTTIQAISGLAPPSIFTDGKNVVFIAVGDLQEPTFQATDGGCTIEGVPGQCGDGGDGTSFNTRSYHYLAFPTDPTVLPYTP